jgi:hypothetical protein
MSASVMSAAMRRSNNPHAQIQHLCRIGNRALKHADWIEELLAPGGYLAVHATIQEVEAAQADVDASRAKAAAAVSEMLTIARANGIRPGHLQVVR